MTHALSDIMIRIVALAEQVLELVRGVDISKACDHNGGLLNDVVKVFSSLLLILPICLFHMVSILVNGSLQMLFLYLKMIIVNSKKITTLFQWACLQMQCIVVMGDLNMDRLIPNRGEGKMLRDLEQVYNLTCLITEPTRVTMYSQTLLDVLLTNTPEMFTRCGVYNPEISDHYLIYGEMTDN